MDSNQNNYVWGDTIETISLECQGCGQFERQRLPHSTSDDEIMNRYFKGWQAKGHDKKEITLCPECAELRPECAARGTECAELQNNGKLS